MDCGRYLELLSARLDGALSEPEERELEAHLKSCPACRAAGAQFAALRPAFAELEDVPAPEGFAQRVMDRIRASEPEKKIVPLFKRPRFRALAGLAACAALAVGLYGAVCPPRRDAELMTRGFSQDAFLGSVDVSADDRLRSVPDFSMINADSDTGVPLGETEHFFYETQKAVPNPAADGLDGAAEPPFAAVITFERLPEGWEELFPGVASPDAMQVSAGEAGAFLQLLEEQGIISEISGSLDENGLCQLLLAGA